MKFSIRIAIILIIGAVLNGSFYAFQSLYIDKQRATISLASNERLITIPIDNSGTIKNPIGSLVFTLGSDKDPTLEVSKKLTDSWSEEYLREFNNQTQIRLVNHELVAYLESIKPDVVKEPTDARFEYRNDKINILTPSENGHELNIKKSIATILKQLSQRKNIITLVIDEIEPKLTLKKMRDLGVNSLLAKGRSDFSGSSNARIHNIRTGASNYHGLIIKPGDEFSFNEILGEVNAQSGYEYELVIKKDKLIPEYGGGICQVSTTLFRAVIRAGLPITERRAHSLPVKYYDPQGFDATIYPGVVDLRFLNDIPSHILVQTKIEDSVLTFELYGSNDNRVVDISGPDHYDEDSDGSLKAVLSRTITSSDGEVSKDSFYSNYRSPELFEIVRNPLE